MIKQLIVASVISLGVSLNASAALKEGDLAPDFNIQASLNGKAFKYSLQEALKNGPVVIYFYPSAYTNGCNVQAHTFAVNHEKFTSAGATIIGVSLDSITRLNEFSADLNYCAGKIPVASDVNGNVARSYDLTVKESVPGKKDTRGIEIDHGFTERTTFVVTPNRKIAAALGGLSPTENVNKALRAVQKIATNR